MSDVDLDALEKIAREATPGNWLWRENEHSLLGAPYGMTLVTNDGDEVLAAADDEVADGGLSWSEPFISRSVADERHIAAFNPPTVLALIERLREAEAKVQQAREQAVKVRDEYGHKVYQDNGFANGVHAQAGETLKLLGEDAQRRREK